MAISAKEKRLKNEKLLKLEKEIMGKEIRLNKHPNNNKLKTELNLLKAQFDARIKQEVEWDLKKVRQKSFEHANKPGKYLAWQLKKKEPRKLFL